MTGLIVVTGGAGFIGSNIVNALAHQGNDVVVVDWMAPGEKWRNIAKADIRDIIPPEELFAFLAGARNEVEAVIHMGAISSTTEPDIDLILKSNYKLSRQLWSWCTDHRSRFIYASSAATYGDGRAGFDDEESVEGLARLRPLNAYGWSKHLFDRFVAREVARGSATPKQWAGLKFFNVYGPNEYHKGAMKSVVAQMFPKASAGEAVTLFKSHNPQYADGGQMRDFIYVKDCVDVVAWLLEHGNVRGLFNLGTGKARTFLDLTKAVFAALNRRPLLNFVDTPEAIREKYQYYTQARMERLRTAGYTTAFTPLEDGVAEYVQRYLGGIDPYR
jgi:ADP-L-glycero-D-manno-heptose 6-epimerase